MSKLKRGQLAYYQGIPVAVASWSGKTVTVEIPLAHHESFGSSPEEPFFNADASFFDLREGCTLELNTNGALSIFHRNYLLHRTDGPAIESGNGDKNWYFNNKRHRIGGPAREFLNGAKWWYQDGQLHREDGPAIEEANDYAVWYIRGQQLTEEEFNERTKDRGTINTE